MNTETSHNDARGFLAGLRGGPLTFGAALAAIRGRESMTQAELARCMGISRSHLCDIEKGRKLVSPALAARYAQVLEHSEPQFIRLALQDQLSKAGLKYHVHIDVDMDMDAA